MKSSGIWVDSLNFRVAPKDHSLLDLVLGGDAISVVLGGDAVSFE
jgi:hypothetical protein